MAYHKCLYNEEKRVLLAVDSTLSPKEHTWALLNYFALTNKVGIPDPSKNLGRYVPNPGDVLKILLAAAFKSKGVKPEPNKWDFDSPNNIKPNKGGGPFDFIRDNAELEVDRKLFLLRDLLGIKFVHGWLDHPNPKDPGDNDGERGLTQYGLDYLIQEIDEGEIALMFRDGILNVVSQHNGSLYMLETDKPTLNKLSVAMWRMVTLDKSHEILFKDRFIPLDLRYQPNEEVPVVVEYFRRLEELDMRSLADALDEIEGEEQDHRRNSTQATGKKKKKKKPPAEAAKIPLTGQAAGKKKTKPVAEAAKIHLTGQAASKKKTKPVAEAAKIPLTGQAASKKKTKPTAEAAEIHPVPSAAEAPAGNVDSDDDGYKWVREKFKNFLEWFIDPDDDAPTKMPFYLRVVEGWKGLHDARNIPYSCRIYFSHIQHQDKNLALAILNGGRRLHDVLDQVFLDFRVSLNCGSKEELEGKVKVRIIGMPPAGRFSKSWEKFEMLESGDVLHLQNTVSEGGKGKEKQSAGKFGSSESRDVKYENFPMLEPPEMMLKACTDFAILDDNNKLMQQDAQEFWTIFLDKVSKTLKRTHCAETEEVTFGIDSCNILRSRVSRDIKTLQEGLAREVKFPSELDMYEFCSDELKQKLQAPGKVTLLSTNLDFPVLDISFVD
ncbi:hypothetical protein ACQ4PT_030389 [Festuca glaucescens]